MSQKHLEKVIKFVSENDSVGISNLIKQYIPGQFAIIRFRFSDVEKFQYGIVIDFTNSETIYENVFSLYILDDQLQMRNKVFKLGSSFFIDSFIRDLDDYVQPIKHCNSLTEASMFFDKLITDGNAVLKSI